MERVCYQINFNFFNDNLSHLVRRCEYAREIIWEELGQIDGRLQRKQSIFYCKVESPDCLEMHITLPFPGANAFAQVEWTGYPNVRFVPPSYETIVEAFLRTDKDGHRVPFLQSRLGAAIVWALERGYTHTLEQHDESVGLAGIDLAKIAKADV